MTPEERAAILKRLREFATLQVEAGELSNKDTLARGADLLKLYHDKEYWVGQLEPPKVKMNRGRPVDPGSQNRFTTWARENADVALAPQTIRALLHAATFIAACSNKSRLNGEAAVRPLYQLDRKGYGDRVDYVLARAQGLAGERATINRAHTQQAVREFLDEQPKPERKRAEAKATAQREAELVQYHIQVMFEIGAFAELTEIQQDMTRRLRVVQERQLRLA